MDRKLLSLFSFFIFSQTLFVYGSLPILAVTDSNNHMIVNNKKFDLFRDSKCSGVVAYVKWSKFETEEGVFNFNNFNKLLQAGRENEKTLSFNLLAGMHTPEWVYEKNNISIFKYTAAKKRKYIANTFLPWSFSKTHQKILNHKVLKIWRNTIKHLAEKINKNKKYIKYVLITGGPTGNGIELMFHIKKYNEFKLLEWDKTSQNILIEYWKGLIDIFFEYFDQDIPLALAVTDVFGVNKNDKKNSSIN